jgi:transcriptional regulatory protein LevR
MSENKKQTINLTEHISNIVFERKENFSFEVNLKNEMVYNNQVLGIQVQSVALPKNYNQNPKTESQVMDWLRNKIHSRYSFAYSMSLKYGEKLNVKLEQKEPYNNN